LCCPSSKIRPLENKDEFGHSHSRLIQNLYRLNFGVLLADRNSVAHPDEAKKEIAVCQDHLQKSLDQLAVVRETEVIKQFLKFPYAGLSSQITNIITSLQSLSDEIENPLFVTRDQHKLHPIFFLYNGTIVHFDYSKAASFKSRIHMLAFSSLKVADLQTKGGDATITFASTDPVFQSFQQSGVAGFQDTLFVLSMFHLVKHLGTKLSEHEVDGLVLPKYV